MNTSDNRSSQNQSDEHLAWVPGLIVEKPAIFYSDGSLLLEDSTKSLQDLRDMLPEENLHETNPAGLARVGRVEIRVIEIEQPILAAVDVMDLLKRVRALPRLSRKMMAELDAVLTGSIA